MLRTVLTVIVLGGAAAALGWVALRTPASDYVAPTLAEVQAHVPAPTSLGGEVPAGSVVRSFDVEGMCCTGCTGKLYASLRALPEVSQAAVSFEDGTAEVVVPAEADPAPIAAALCFEKYRATLRPERVP
jgi:copper chaperone CopZ